MAKKKANTLEISDIRVKYDKTDGSLRITSKDPDLRGKPFSITLTTSSPTAKTILELMDNEGLIEPDRIPAGLVLSTAEEVANLYDPEKPLTFSVGETFGGEVVKLDLRRTAHVVIAGNTGAGKSVLINTLAEQAKLRSNMNVTVCENFHSYSSSLDPAHYINTIEELQTTINRLYEMLEIRGKLLIAEGVYSIETLSTPLPFELLFIDQASQFLREFKSKPGNEFYVAKQKQIRDKLFTLVRMGRSMGIHIILASQHFDSSTLPHEPNENFLARFLMGPATHTANRAMFYAKPEFGMSLLQHRGRGVAQIDKEQIPFQAYSVPYTNHSA